MQIPQHIDIYIRIFYTKKHTSPVKNIPLDRKKLQFSDLVYVIRQNRGIPSKKNLRQGRGNSSKKKKQIHQSSTRYLRAPLPVIKQAKGLRNKNLRTIIAWSNNNSILKGAPHCNQSDYLFFPTTPDDGTAGLTHIPARFIAPSCASAGKDAAIVNQRIK